MAKNVFDHGRKKNVKKAKGVKKSVLEKEIQHEQYKEALFEKKQFWHRMNILRSEGHKIYGMRMNKVSLLAFDTKQWIAEDGVHTLAYGHKDIIRHKLVREEAAYLEAQPTALHKQSRA